MDTVSVEGSQSCVPFLARPNLTMECGGEGRKESGREEGGREGRPWSSNGGNKKDADGPPVATSTAVAARPPVVRPVDSTFADGALARVARLRSRKFRNCDGQVTAGRARPTARRQGERPTSDLARVAWGTGVEAEIGCSRQACIAAFPDASS